MRRIIFSLLLLGIFASCEESPKKEEGTPADAKVQIVQPNNDDIEKDLKERGYQTFSYKEGDTTYLMQQYYIVFLKSGPARNQDSLTAAKLQEAHMAHMTRMFEEGYTSLTGPMGDDGNLRGIVIYNTATQQEADSLARLDPMVRAGRLEVEVRPWWVAKGGKLK